MSHRIEENQREGGEAHTYVPLVWLAASSVCTVCTECVYLTKVHPGVCLADKPGPRTAPKDGNLFSHQYMPSARGASPPRAGRRLPAALRTPVLAVRGILYVSRGRTKSTVPRRSVQKTNTLVCHIWLAMPVRVSTVCQALHTPCTPGITTTRFRFGSDRGDGRRQGQLREPLSKLFAC